MQTAVKENYERPIMEGMKEKKFDLSESGANDRENYSVPCHAVHAVHRLIKEDIRIRSLLRET